MNLFNTLLDYLERGARVSGSKSDEEVKAEVSILLKKLVPLLNDKGAGELWQCLEAIQLDALRNSA